jgi:hypothetical protein
MTLDTVKALKRLKAPKRLQKEALKVMVKHLNQEDIGVIRVIFIQRSFMAIDKNNTGYLTAEELGQALLRSGLGHAKEEIDEIVNRVKYLSKGKLK